LKVRFRFSKEGETCYLGHLDMMRFFQKAIRRAHIDIAYSQGFNPHQILSFASPLGLGMTSQGEYFDAELKSCGSGRELLEAINGAMTEGIRVLGVRRIPDEGKYNAMAALTACSYMVSFDESFAAEYDLCGMWQRFISRDSIPVTKKTKTQTVETDLRPLILDSGFSSGRLRLLLAAGSVESVKAVAVLSAFFESSGIPLSGEQAFKAGTVRIERLDQFTGDKDKLTSLGEVGEEI